MNGEARKLNLLSVLLTENDDTIWDEIEKLLRAKQTASVEKSSLEKFAGMLTHEEALEMKRVINESSEQIDPNDWK